MIDAHIHLDHYPKQDIPLLIDVWRETGIEGVVAVSTNLSSCYETLDLACRFPDFVYPCLGWHPEQPLPNDHELDELIQLIRMENHRIAGIGEIGLPHYSLEKLGYPSLEPYLELVTMFLREANDHRLPVALHAVHDKAAIVIDLLQREQVTKAHFHWLKADSATLQAIIQSGYMVSVTPEVCYRKRDEILAAQVPLGQLLLETDGPWPFAGPFQGKQTTPVFLQDSAIKIAELKEIPLSAAKKYVTRNARMFYNKE